MTAAAADTTYSDAERHHTGVAYMVHQNGICPTDLSIVQIDTSIIGPNLSLTWNFVLRWR